MSDQGDRVRSHAAYAYLPTFDLSHIQTVNYDFVPETTHFLQVEKPAECIGMMRGFLEECGLVR